MDAICPNCRASGVVGAQCLKEGCAVQEMHCIPAEFVNDVLTEPLGRDPLLGRMVGDHLVASRIGGGGFGALYIALQMPVLMKTALKVLRVEKQKRPSTGQDGARFETEAKALARLVHPNIVRLIKYGTFNGFPYIVMEYVAKGRELARELEERRTSGAGFSLRESRHIVTQILNALAAAHNDDVIHRDIKPANIMLQPVEGDPLFVRVLDFGLAKMVAETPDMTVAQGTPLYMAPEQYFGRDIGPWTDLYATALVALELMTGRKPFSATSSQELYSKKTTPGFDLTQEATWAGLPEVVARFMRKATAMKTLDRFRTVFEFLAAANAMFDDLEAAQLRSLHSDGVDTAGETLLVAPRMLAPEDVVVAASVATATSPPSDAASWPRVAQARIGAVATATSPPAEAAPGQSRAQARTGGAGTAAADGRTGLWRKLWFFLGAVAFAGGLALAVLWFWPGKSPEIGLSDTNQGDQTSPTLSALPDGRVASAWVSAHAEGSTIDVMARMLSADGEPEGKEIRVSTFDGDYKYVPTSAAFRDGRVLVVWTSEGQDGGGMGIFGQWLAPDLTPYRDEFVVNADFQEADQECPDIAVAPDDRFAVVWQSYGQDGDDFGFVCQLFKADGARQGGSFVVNAMGLGRQRFPAIAAQVDGRYMVVWESSHSGQRLEDYTVFGQLLDGNGQRVGDSSAINTFSRGRQRYPDVATLPGGYVVVWTSEEQDGSGRGVYGQLLDRSGARTGDEFRVNTFTTGDQWLPKVASLPDGRFVVLWISGGQDGSGLGVFGQAFAADGSKDGKEFRLNQYSDSDQILRSVAPVGDERFVAAWESDEQDGSGWGVFARFWSLAGTQGM
jgi:hypothetical protein